MPVQSHNELLGLMAALKRMRNIPNAEWEHRDPRIREVLREYLTIWKEAEQADWRNK